MKNDLTLDAVLKMSEAESLSLLLAANAENADGFRRGCILVAARRQLGFSLPNTQDVYRYADQVADGRLSANAAWVFGARPFMINAIMGLDHEWQDRLAGGEKIKIAVKVDGRIRSAEKGILEMSQMQMRLAFCDGKITPWEEQGEWLLKSGYIEPDTIRKPAVPKYSEKQDRIMIGGKAYMVEDFMQAFGAAGFQIVPIYKSRRLTPPRVVG